MTGFGRPPRRRGPLGLSLSSGAAGAGGVGLLSVLVAGLAAGWRGSASAGVGVVVVLLFFVLSLYLVEVANTAAPSLTLPAGIAVYSALVSWLGLLAFGTSLPERLHKPSFAWTVIAATLAWLLTQGTAVWRQRVLYVDVPLPGDPPGDQETTREARRSAG